MDAFTGMGGIEKIWGKGATKSSVRLKKGFDIDLRVVPESAYGSAIQYFTGSKDHNVKLRMRAIERGLKLNEYGVFKGKDMLPSASEEDVYGHLGLPWIPPELREDTGEIEAAAAGKLPALVAVSDIRGDLHCHSDWDGGADPIMELVKHARVRGYSYIGISDHTKFLKIEKGLDEKKLMERNREIDRLNKTLHGFRILKGCEANILNDGAIDIDDEVLARMDYVIAGVHSNLRMDEGEMTARLTRAMENPHVDIISHPTGRLIGKREEYRIRTDTLISVAARTGTILEVNSFPDRLDLNDRNIRHAIREGVKLVINTDSHSIPHMGFMELGVMQARRGWAQKHDIVNTYRVEKLLACMKG
jgi:DNA polymerase (family 10)